MSVTRNAAVQYVTDICDLQKLKHGDDQHTVPEWITITSRQLQKAEDAWYIGRKTEALHRLAHVAACGVTAVEQNGEGPKADEDHDEPPEREDNK